MTRNHSLVLCTLSMAAMTFGLGGYAVWMPTFFNRVWGMDVGQAGKLFGVITVVGGLIGSLAGGWLADFTLKFNSRAYFLVSGIGLLVSFPLACITLSLSWLPGVVVALLLTEICVFLNMGPLNAIIVSVTGPKIRSMAFAANIFVLHSLGDVPSPYLIGYVSDIANLKIALVFASVPLAVAGLFCLWGMRYLDRDTREAEMIHA